METIGFIGLGNMGGNMAARYLDAGYRVYGQNRDRGAVQWLIDRGLRWVATPREIAEAADLVMTSLPDDEVVEAVATGPDGIIAGLEHGKLWADLSTISPRASRALARRVSEEALGAQMLDTPVSGSVPQVKSGTLSIMVGGDGAAFTRIEPTLRLLGTPTYIGANGQGLVLKLAINISLAAQTVAFSEGLLLAERDGIDAGLAARVMSDSQIGSPMLKLRVPLMLDPPDEAWFNIGLMHKDIRLARATGVELATPLPSAAVADGVLDEAEQLGYGGRDLATVHQVLAELPAGGERLA